MTTTRARLVPAFLFVDFAALNLYALYDEGFSGLVELFAQNANAWFWVLAIDLCIALGIACHYIWQEAKRDGRSKPVGYMILTVLLGSIGPLLYLVIGRRQRAEKTVETTMKATRA